MYGICKERIFQFDGDILRPGYRTVDFLDVEQPAEDRMPRDYPEEWLEVTYQGNIQYIFINNFCV